VYAFEHLIDYIKVSNFNSPLFFIDKEIICKILIGLFLVTNELMQEKQRANDLEEEIQLVQKHLKTTQAKVAEQVNDKKNFF
jgi:hypothetical protein